MGPNGHSVVELTGLSLKLMIEESHSMDKLILPNTSNILPLCFIIMPKLKSSIRANFMKTYGFCVFLN